MSEISQSILFPKVYNLIEIFFYFKHFLFTYWFPQLLGSGEYILSFYAYLLIHIRK